MAKVANLIKMGLIGSLLLFFLGFGIKTYEVAPEYAFVLVDSDKRVYLAPQCVPESRAGLKKITIREARKAGFKRDRACIDPGAFMLEARSPSGWLLEKIGILGPLKPHWNKDGSWNIERGAASLTMLNETPEQMLKNVHALTEAGAVLVICFESPVYKTLSNKKASELHGMLRRIRDLVQAIAQHYYDDALYMWYETSKGQMSLDSQLKEYVRDTYRYCDEKLFSEMDSYVTDNEKSINDFLNKHSQN